MKSLTKDLSGILDDFALCQDPSTEKAPGEAAAGEAADEAAAEVQDKSTAVV